MITEDKAAADLNTLLSDWARERLEAIGVYESENDKYEKWAAKIISDLRGTYSDTAIRLFLRPVNRGLPGEYTRSARLRGECGDTVEIYLKTGDGVIKDVHFTTDGCDPSVAACGALAEIARGMSEKEAGCLCGGDILEYLGLFPEENAHCALLAVNALKKALAVSANNISE